MKLIHYGSRKFIPEKVMPIKNDNWVKPKGGLWTSPLESNWSWKHWCESEHFRDCNPENSFTIELKSSAKIFVIDSLNDLKQAPLIRSYKDYLNFELLAKSYDAIWLTENGQLETHLSYPLDLYGWDCESVLVMNPICVSVLLPAQPRPARQLGATNAASLI